MQDNRGLTCAQPVLQAFGAHRMSIIKALRISDSEFVQVGCLALRFNAFCNHLQVELTSHGNDALDDIEPVAIQLGHETLVDLEEVETEILQLRNAVVLCAEIIDCQRYTQRFQRVKGAY